MERLVNMCSSFMDNIYGKLCAGKGGKQEKKKPTINVTQALQLNQDQQQEQQKDLPATKPPEILIRDLELLLKQLQTKETEIAGYIKFQPKMERSILREQQALELGEDAAKKIKTTEEDDLNDEQKEINDQFKKSQFYKDFQNYIQEIKKKRQVKKNEIHYDYGVADEHSAKKDNFFDEIMRQLNIKKLNNISDFDRTFNSNILKDDPQIKDILSFTAISIINNKQCEPDSYLTTQASDMYIQDSTEWVKDIELIYIISSVGEHQLLREELLKQRSVKVLQFMISYIGEKFISKDDTKNQKILKELQSSISALDKQQITKEEIKKLKFFEEFLYFISSVVSQHIWEEELKKMKIQFEIEQKRTQQSQVKIAQSQVKVGQSQVQTTQAQVESQVNLKQEQEVNPKHDPQEIKSLADLENPSRHTLKSNENISQNKLDDNTEKNSKAGESVGDQSSVKTEDKASVKAEKKAGDKKGDEDEYEDMDDDEEGEGKQLEVDYENYEDEQAKSEIDLQNVQKKLLNKIGKALTNIQAQKKQLNHQVERTGIVRRIVWFGKNSRFKASKLQIEITWIDGTIAEVVNYFEQDYKHQKKIREKFMMMQSLFILKVIHRAFYQQQVFFSNLLYIAVEIKETGQHTLKDLIQLRQKRDYPYRDTEVTFIIQILNSALVEAKKLNIFHSNINDENIFFFPELKLQNNILQQCKINQSIELVILCFMILIKTVEEQVILLKVEVEQVKKQIVTYQCSILLK